MSLTNKNILRVKITVSKQEYILEEIWKYLSELRIKNNELRKKEIKPLVIFTPNPEIINFAQKDDIFRKIVNSAQINIPDGAGVVWAIKKIHGISIKKIPGTDFVRDLIKLAEKEGIRIGLIGGRDGVAVEVLECLRSKYPGLRGEALGEPEVEINNDVLSIKYYVLRDKKKKDPALNTKYVIRDTIKKDNQETQKYLSDLIMRIKQKKISILFVALGHPKQEYFIEKVRSQMSKVKNSKPLVIMAVGGAFDYISGRVPRAPEWMRKKGLEWLYRLIREPKRLGRQISGGEFFLRVIGRSLK